MSLLAMQRALACLLTDAGLRDRFFADPDRTLAPMDLSARERASLLGIDRKRIAAHADIVAEARFERALRGFPAVRGVLSSEIAALAGAFVQRFPRASPERAEEAARVVALLSEQRPSAPHWPAYLEDVARYEAKVIGLGGTSVNVSRARARPPRAGGDDPLSPGEDDRVAPRRREGVEVLSFEHDVLALVRRICTGKAPPRASRRPTVLLLCFDLATFAVRTHRLTELSRRVLDLCDGRRSAAGVLATIVDEARSAGGAATIAAEPARRAAIAAGRRALRAMVDASAVALDPIHARASGQG